MPERDYLLRLIEQMIEAVLQAAKLRKAGQPEQAIHSAVSQMEKLLGLPPGGFGSLSIDQLFFQLTQDERPEDARNKCLAFAALSREAGLAYADKDLSALAQPAFYLSLVFTLIALTRYPRANPPPFTPAVDELLGRLDGFELPESDQELLRTYRAQGA